MARYKAKASKGALTFVGIMAFVAVLGVVAIALGLASNWSYWIPKKYLPGGNVGGDNAGTVAVAPGGDMLVQQTEDNGIRLFSAPMAIAEVENYEITPYAENVQMLTATISPSNATVQKVDFTCAWERNSSWADKDINEYIQLTQTTDGALTCAVALLQPIGSKAIITCTARPLSEEATILSATCTVDYYKRVKSAKFGFYGNTDDGEKQEDDYTIEISEGTTIKYEDIVSDFDIRYPGQGYVCQNRIYVGINYGIGTIIESYKEETINVKVSISDSVAQSIKSAAGVSSLSSYTLATNGVCGGYKIKTAIDTMLGGASNVEKHRTAIYNAFKAAYDAGKAALKFEIIFQTEPSGFTYNYTYNVHLNPLAIAVKATNLDLDQDNIIFGLKAA